MGTVSFINVLREYFDGTYQPQMFVLAMELGIFSISISQADHEIFGELNNFFIKWHTIFLGPITIGAPLVPLFEGIWPGGKAPNMMISILSIIQISLFPMAPKLSICFLVFICLIYFLDNVNSLAMILFSILFGYSFLFLREIIGPSYVEKLPISHVNYKLEQPDRVWKYDFNESIYLLTMIFTFITILTQFRVINIKGTSNYHSILVKNLGFVVFDFLIHHHGTEDNFYVMVAFCCNFILNFISNQMSSYGFSFSFF